jgi:hypothetical protein
MSPSSLYWKIFSYCDPNILGVTYNQGRKLKLCFIWAESVGSWSLTCDGR